MYSTHVECQYQQYFREVFSMTALCCRNRGQLHPKSQQSTANVHKNAYVVIFCTTCKILVGHKALVI